MVRHSYAFTARQVVDITKMSKGVLADLVKRDVVSPSTHRGTGTGDNHLFDVLDVFGVAAIQAMRPKAETAMHMRALFEFWHSADGRRIAERGDKTIDGVVVLDDTGRVALEKETDTVKLAASRKSPVLYVIEPNMLSKHVFMNIALFRMEGDHAQPLPSGREPRTRRSEPKVRPRQEMLRATNEALESDAERKRKPRRRT